MIDKEPPKTVRLLRLAAPEFRRGTRSEKMRILITGNMGYVGPVLTRFLREHCKERS